VAFHFTREEIIHGRGRGGGMMRPSPAADPLLFTIFPTFPEGTVQSHGCKGMLLVAIITTATHNCFPWPLGLAWCSRNRAFDAMGPSRRLIRGAGGGQGGLGAIAITINNFVVSQRYSTFWRIWSREVDRAASGPLPRRHPTYSCKATNDGVNIGHFDPVSWIGQTFLTVLRWPGFGWRLLARWEGLILS